ncbi:MAG: hypothetical protein ACRD2L_25945, partial [Terriglobia bacterium]
ERPLLAQGGGDGRSHGTRRPTDPLRTNTRLNVHALSEMSEVCVPINALRQYQELNRLEHRSLDG